MNASSNVSLAALVRLQSSRRSEEREMVDSTNYREIIINKMTIIFTYIFKRRCVRVLGDFFES